MYRGKTELNQCLIGDNTKKIYGVIYIAKQCVGIINIKCKKTVACASV